MFGGRKPSTPQPSGAPTPPNPPPAPPPAAPPPTRPTVGFETVLGANTAFKGEIKSRANVRIDGQFEGDVQVDGNLLIGETARVHANVQAKSEIRIAGAVRGDVSGYKVHLARTGRVWGDITTNFLVTEEGAFIEGKINMINHPALEQGFGGVALPSPEVSVTAPDREDAARDAIEAELMDDDRLSRED
jgi:cytoskeletal protein CcmA (bactofilin family)